MIAAALRIPVVHTYHTQYEDYVGYIAKGKIIKPGMVKYIIRGYLNDLDGVICPSRIVLNLLDGYDIKILNVLSRQVFVWKNTNARILQQKTLKLSAIN